MTPPIEPIPLTQSTRGDDGEISLAEIIGVLFDAKWLVAGIAGVFLFIAFLYALFATPIYTSSALVQVNQKSGGLSGLETLSSMIEGTALPVEAEIQLAKSNSVLQAAVESAHADVVVEPRHFPFIGTLLARRYRGLAPAPARFGASEFSWGNDQIEVTRFDVPAALHDQSFRLTVVSPDSFRLADPEGNMLLTGRVGVLAQADSGSVAIMASRIAARPGVGFLIQRRNLQAMAKNVGSRLSVSEQGHQSGILVMTLSGPDRKAETALLTAIVHADIDFNRNLRTEQAAAQISFLEGQLPIMQQRVDSARRLLGNYQSKHKVMNLDEESQALINRLSTIDQAILTVALQRAQIQQQFGSASPAMRSVLTQQDTLQQQRNLLEQQVAKLPLAAQSMLQLQENLEVTSSLYTGLLTSIQQLQVVKAGSIGDLSVVDLPVQPDGPSGPRRARIVGMGLLLGLIAGAGAAVARRAFLQRVDDPAMLRTHFALPTLGVLPFSSEQAQREQSGGDPDRLPLLATEDPQAATIEEIRSLRTSLQFLMPTAQRPILCISGPVSGVGKSFVSANLARLSADAGMRVLVIDADMRRGHLNRYFGLAQEPGLSSVLIGAAEPAAAIRPAGAEGLSIVTAGVYPPNPAELLLRPAFSALLDYAASRFDLIIIDAPPLLPVTDGIIIAQQASMNIVVAKAGAHTIRELDATLSRYRQSGIRPDGFVMNYMRPRAGGYGYSYGYQYKYSYRTAKTK